MKKIKLFSPEHSSKTRIILIRLLMFMTAVAIITYFYPREGKFKYQFNEGKPWKYGLLTASFTFPVYKSEKVIKTEQDSVLKGFLPYFKYNSTVGKEQIEKLKTNINSSTNISTTSSHLKYIVEKLSEIYSAGIIESVEMEKLQKEGVKSIKIIDGNISHEEPIEKLFTTKSAYEYVLNNTPGYLNKATIQSYNINKYIAENLQFDKEVTDRLKAESINMISPTSGVVQVGERIIDKGEIINKQTYNILHSLKQESEQRSGTIQEQGWVIAGEALLISCLLSFLFLFLYLFRFPSFKSIKLLFFILLIVSSFAIITALNAQLKYFSIYIIPYAIVPIIIRTFFDSRTALFTNIITVLICSFMAPFPFEFILLQLTAGMTVIYSLKDLAQRSQLVQTALFIVLTYSLMYLGFGLVQEGTLEKFNWMMYVYFFINGILILFSYLMIYIFEKIFGFVSHVTLVELSNINSPFLRKFSEECPGTFHHSLQVSNLAAEASMRINANTQLIRTAALYHDIGKMENPVFFTENQAGVNPHDKLEIEQSAKIIINHVKDGVRIAQKIGLPQQIIDFITTHQGTSKASYFYNSYKNRYPDREIDEKLFTYPGPNPFTKETAILMMADSVEAASRSLSEYTEQSITKLVTRIIDGQVQQGLFNNAPISLLDIQTIKHLFIEKLKTYYHTRIQYPELDKKEEE